MTANSEPKEDSWLAILDVRPDWMEQRANGVGFTVSSSKILRSLKTKYNVSEEHLPDKAAIAQERKRRLED